MVVLPTTPRTNNARLSTHLPQAASACQLRPARSSEGLRVSKGPAQARYRPGARFKLHPILPGSESGYPAVVPAAEDSLTARARVQEGPGPEIEMGLRLGESHVGTDHPYRASADSDAAGAARPLNWAIVTLGDCHG